MKKIILVAFVLAVSVFFASYGFSAEKTTKNQTGPVQAILGVPAKVVEPIVKTATGTNDAKAKKPKEEEALKSPKDMTQSELASTIKQELTNNEEITKFIPEIKKETAKDGKVSFTYNGAGIDSLSKETLEKLFGRVRNEGVRIRTERLNRQMQNLRRIQDATRVNRSTGNLTGTARTTKSPKPYTAPKVPRIPRNPVPATPKIPKSYTTH